MQFFWHLLFMTAVTIPNMMAYNLIFGKGKILYFGPIAVSAAAAYGTFAALPWTQSYPESLLIGLLLGLVTALLFAWLALRLDPDGFGVMSIAVHLMFLAIILNWTSVTRGALGIPRIPRFPFLETQEQMAIAALILGIVWFCIFWFLDRSPLGRKLEALAEHEWSALSLGISRASVYVTIFAMSAVAALMANVLITQYIRLLHPSDFAFFFVPYFIMIVVAGKPGSVWGVLLSIIFLTLLKEGLRFVELPADLLGPLRLLLFGIILFGAVLWRRKTLFPSKRTV